MSKSLTLVLVSILLASACLLVPWTATAQCTRSCGLPPPSGFVTLYTFSGQPDGASPQGSLIRDAAGNLYGTTEAGGTFNLGTVFKLNTSGAETILYSFTGAPDGANPEAELTLDSAGNLYGTTAKGGITGGVCATDGCGIVFKVDATGKETVLYSFMGNPDGWNPLAGLVLDSSGNLYGTTRYGGGIGPGTVFKLDANGKETVLHSFSNAPDGADPAAGVILDSSGHIYGTTSGGGTLNCTAGNGFNTPKQTVGCGAVFMLDSTGTESVLYSFQGKNDGPDGAFPGASLVRDPQGNLYGTTLAGGAAPIEGGLCFVIAMNPPQPPVDIYCGTVFKLDPMGKETVLHNFAGGSFPGPIDGVSPHGALVLDAAGNLYGTTFYGGTGNCIESGNRPGTVAVHVGCGTIFKVDSAGNETVLYNFTSGTDGSSPRAGLFLDPSGTLFGTTSAGGTSNSGTIFSFNPASGASTLTLSVTLAGNGSGVVSSDPAGISCGNICSADFDSGTPVVLTTISSAGSSFVGWSGACSGSGTCSITVSATESVTATFSTTPSPDFSLTPAFQSMTVQPGSQGTDLLTISPQNGFQGSAVQLTCTVTGSTPIATCAMSPPSITLGASSATSTLTVTAPKTATASILPANSTQLIASACTLLAPFGFGLAVAAGSRKHRSGLWMLFCFLLLMSVLPMGCGGGSIAGTTGSSMSYSVTVTATSGAIVHAVQVSVTVP